MEAQVTALESYVRDLRARLNEREEGFRLARDAIALQLCLTLYQLIVASPNPN